LKSSNITAKRRAKSKKNKFNSGTGEETSNCVKFVRRSSRIIQEKRYEIIYQCTLLNMNKIDYSELLVIPTYMVYYQV